MPFENANAQLGSCALPYFAAGAGRPVLCLHSSGGIRITPALEKLSQSYRLYFPIIPGFDGTPPVASLRSMHDVADLTAEFAETVIKEPCDVIGHSFGGRVAAWLAILHPATVQLLVLAAASIRPDGEERKAGSTEEMHRRLFAHPEKLPPETKSAEILAQNRTTSLRLRGTAQEDQELTKRLSEIQALTLILYGTKDGDIPISGPRLLKRTLPRSILMYVYDAAHAIDSDQPEHFVGLVDRFLTYGEGFIVNRGDAVA